MKKGVDRQESYIFEKNTPSGERDNSMKLFNRLVSRKLSDEDAEQLYKELTPEEQDRIEKNEDVSKITSSMHTSWYLTTTLQHIQSKEPSLLTDHLPTFSTMPPRET